MDRIVKQMSIVSIVEALHGSTADSDSWGNPMKIEVIEEDEDERK